MPEDKNDHKTTVIKISLLLQS